MKKTLLALATVLASSAHAQAPANPDPAAEAVLIRQARSVQTQAMGREDLDEVQKYWAPEITIRRAMGQPVDGAAAARKLLEPSGTPNPNRLIYQRQAVTVQVSSQWPLAYEEGEWSGHPGTVQAGAVIGGRYAAQWVKRDGRWLIRSEVFVALTCADAGCKAVAAP